MKSRLFVLAVVTVFVGLAGVAGAASSDNHTVTVQVNAVNEIGLSGGNITLTVDTAVPGSDLTGPTDNTTCDLAWTTNQASKKVTVQTDQAAPSFTLKVAAQNVSGGTAAAEVTLSTTAQDFVTGISQTVGSCDLAYTASATAAQGTGSDVHTITYTITDA